MTCYDDGDHNAIDYVRWGARLPMMMMLIHYISWGIGFDDDNDHCVFGWHNDDQNNFHCMCKFNCGDGDDDYGVVDKSLFELLLLMISSTRKQMHSFWIVFLWRKTIYWN